MDAVENPQSNPRFEIKARNYLPAPTSSIDSNCLFLESDNIYKSKHNRIQPENAERIIWSNHSLRYHRQIPTFDDTRGR